MTELTTKADIIAFAFQRPIGTVKIPDGLIASIQLKHIRPILQKTLFDKVLQDPTAYTDLVDLIKPVISFFAKFYILPEIYNDISNSGINKIPGINRAAGTMDDLGSARQIALDQANLAAAMITDYFRDNQTLYPDYIWQQDPNNRIDISGGIISRNPTCLDDFDNDH